MHVRERLRQLDRRAEAFGRRYQREYDVPPPVWLKYGGLVLILLSPGAVPLSVASSPVVTMAVLGSLLGVYAVVVCAWVVRHRR